MSAVETQPERTALAWQRTGLGVLAVAALLGHRALEQRSAVALVVAGLAALAGLGVLGGLAPLRTRQVQRRTAGAIAAPRLLALATGAVVLAALAAAVAVLMPM